MALIEYMEAVSPGELFAGVGIMVLTFVIAYIFYRIYIKLAQFLDVIFNREAKYEILEESFLDKIGEKHGVNLDKELIKRKMLEKRKKSFRRKLEEEIYDEMFGKEKESKK